MLASCLLCARHGAAAEGAHWSYDGEAGPDHWGSLSPANAVCSAGSQQSPLDIAGTIKAEIRLARLLVLRTIADDTALQRDRRLDAGEAAGRGRRSGHRQVRRPLS